MPIGELTLPILVVAALVDSINPCVFGVLIFLIAFMTKVFKNPHKMLVGGAIYTIIVYITYFVLGLGFLKITVSFGVSQSVYWIAALIAILAGLVEIKDYFWYGKGFSLRMTVKSSERVKKYTAMIGKAQEKHILFSYLIAAFLGFFVVLVELPCTGAPYLAVLALIGQGNYSEGISLLLLYNLIFILPLFFIIGVAYFGKSSKTLHKWKEQNKKFMRLVTGIFLILLGLYMIYSIW
ncbi:sulfite exporter TauE/SafE family protein [Candidatus Woesearchaeota archaeon]|nr:sulfite exporter TauE/SafE family protein [Candidatus Woesearchaeota archaeon]